VLSEDMCGMPFGSLVYPLYNAYDKLVINWVVHGWQWLNNKSKWWRRQTSIGWYIPSADSKATGILMSTRYHLSFLMAWDKSMMTPFWHLHLSLHAAHLLHRMFLLEKLCSWFSSVWTTIKQTNNAYHILEIQSCKFFALL